MKSLIASIGICLMFSSLAVAQNADKIDYYANGKVKAEYFVADNNGVDAKFYYSTGQLKETGSYSDNLKDGEWISYTRSGEKSAVGTYAMGEKSGVWKFWNAAGELSHTVDYNFDQPKLVVYNQ